jgi:head-tail adaptor
MSFLNKPPALADLKDHLVFEKSNQTPDQMGGFTVSYTPHLQTWGKVEPYLPTYSPEIWQAGHPFLLRCYRIWIRNHISISAEFHVKWKKFTLRIVSEPVTTHKDKWQVFWAEESKEETHG